VGFKRTEKGAATGPAPFAKTGKARGMGRQCLRRCLNQDFRILSDKEGKRTSKEMEFLKRPAKDKPR